MFQHLVLCNEFDWFRRFATCRSPNDAITVLREAQAAGVEVGTCVTLL